MNVKRSLPKENQADLMSYQLTNQRDPEQSIRLSNQAWYGILELAEDYGWRPLGTILPERYGSASVFFDEDPSQWYGDYWSDGERLVILEDALNLGDALEEAYLDYEPIRLSSLHGFSWNGFHQMIDRPLPAIGIVKIMSDFCLLGAFSIDNS